MDDYKRCPVCNTEISADADICPKCGMDDLNRIFLDKESYEWWVENYLNPYRTRYNKIVEKKEDNYIDEDIPASFLPPTGEVLKKEEDERELRKIRLTISAKEAEKQHNYTKAANIWNEIASICHVHGLHKDARWVEHAAFLCTQKEIYREADISLDVFCGKTPFAENLKVVMTREAEQAWEKKEIDKYVILKLVNARICRAQGKKEDAYLLENSALPYKETVENVLGQKKITWTEFEKQCLKDLARKYEAGLYQ